MQTAQRFRVTHRLRHKNRRRSKKSAKADGKLLAFRLAYSSTLNVEAIYSFEIFGWPQLYGVITQKIALVNNFLWGGT
jgi:hypothetical protein